MSTSVAGQRIIVINSNNVAADLLDRRGTIYSDRPRFIREFCRDMLINPGFDIHGIQWRARYSRAGWSFSWPDTEKRACRISLSFQVHFSSKLMNESSWRRLRRASHEALNKGRAAMYRPLQEKEAILLIDGIFRNPAGWERELRR